MRTGSESSGAASGTPEALAYAPVGVATRFRRRRFLRLGLYCVGLLLVLLLIDLGLDTGPRSYVCQNCGARSETRRLTLFGVGGEYRRRITSGPISRFIETQTGQVCTHRWLFCHGLGGGWLSGYIADGVGGWRGFNICELERRPVLPALLSRKVREDPAFLRHLKAAIGSYDKQADQFMQSLLDEAMPQLASMPS